MSDLIYLILGKVASALGCDFGDLKFHDVFVEINDWWKTDGMNFEFMRPLDPDPHASTIASASIGSGNRLYYNRLHNFSVEFCPVNDDAFCTFLIMNFQFEQNQIYEYVT